MKKREDSGRLSIRSIREKKKRMLIVAHRGCSSKAPENTIAAFEMAIDQGVDMIECDVRLTKDGEVVCLHDRTLDRTTSGKGRVEKQTLSEVKKLDAGSWFHRRFAGERVPTLSETLDLVDGNAYLNIELKAEGRGGTAKSELMDRVLQTVREHRAERRVFLGSFNHSLMRRVKAANSNLTTAVIYRPVRDIGSSPSRLVARAHADAFVCGRWWLSKRILEDLRNHKIPLLVYTIDSKRDAERMAAWNVDGIITNKPDLVARH